MKPVPPTPLGDDAMLKLPAVAECLSVSLRTVHRLIGDRTRPLPVRRIGHARLVRIGDLREWIQQAPEVGV